MRRIAGVIALALSVALSSMIFPSMAAAAAVDSSLRPKPRDAAVTRPKARAEPQIAAATQSTGNARFDLWVKAFRRKAIKKGISGKVYDRAVKGIRYNSYVIDKDRNQSEFTKQIWDYLDTATSETRVRNGKSALARYGSTLNQIERRYGVDKEVVLAIWGLESAYGAQKGDIDIIEALATLAFDGRRKTFFEAQLIAALQILQSGDVRPRAMTGSWAGAMGHTQFMPNSYLAYAVDFRGDGRRDIWGKNPEDALASTANYLKKFGWKKGQPWGLEVKLPKGFKYALAGERIKKPVADWIKLGVKQIDGTRLPNHGRASILLPAGARGAAFIIFDNFHVIERYNPADAYVIAVGHLGDRIMGGDVIQSSWPRGEKALSFKQKKQMQRLLRRKGFEVEKIDGIVGPNTIAAIRAFQASIGQTPDGYATTDLLTLLRRN